MKPPLQASGAFNDPETLKMIIYCAGIIIGGMATAIAAMWRRLNKQTDDQQEVLVELNVLLDRMIRGKNES